MTADAFVAGVGEDNDFVSLIQLIFNDVFQQMTVVSSRVSSLLTSLINVFSSQCARRNEANQLKSKRSRAEYSVID